MIPHLEEKTSEKLSPVTLKFASEEVESTYQNWNYRSALPTIRVLILVSIGIHMLFIVMDGVVLGEEYFKFAGLRLYILIPLNFIVFLLSFSQISENNFQNITSLVVLINGFLIAIGNYMFDELYIIYFGVGAVMVVMYAFILSPMSFFRAVIVAWIIIAANLIVSFLVREDVRRLTSEILTLVVSGGMLTVAAYMLEKTRRESFCHLLTSLMKESEKNEAEKLRLIWLENMTGFLRHEMRNALAGITSSIQLLKRKARIVENDKYIDRANTSIKSITHLIDTATMATNLESALHAEKKEKLRLDVLVQNQIEKYQMIYPHTKFSSNTGDVIYVEANEERIVQVMDNLINNAIEHGDETQPVKIELYIEDGLCVLSVIDVGDPLPEDKEEIFNLFVSHKTTKTANNGLGIGLYIVKQIIEGYGGTVAAISLDSQVGAEFRVSLPIEK